MSDYWSKMRGMCFDFKWVQDLKSVCNSDQTIFSCKSFWVKSWWRPMKLGIRWWSSESSNEKNVGTRFYLVIVRKHTKVKHFAFVASLSVFSYVWLCKFDQTITMLDDDNGWLPLFRNKIFLRKKRSHVHILLLYSKQFFTFEPMKMSVCKLA